MNRIEPKISNRHTLIALFLFSAVAVVFTFPLIFKINSFIPGFFGTDESFGMIRKFWWYKYSWLHHIPYEKDSYICVPFGFKHQQLFLYPLWEVICRWLAILSNEIIAYNLVFFSALLLSALIMYRLTFYLTKDLFSSIFSGIIYAFCPYFFARSWQHFGLIHIQWFPLCLLALFKIKDHPTRRNFFFLVFALFIAIAFDDQYAFFTSIVTLVFLLWLIFTGVRKNLALIGLISLAGVIALVLNLPSILAIIGDVREYSKIAAPAYNLAHRPLEDLFAQSARPLSYFLPAVVHPIFGKFTLNFLGTKLYGESITEHTLYLGWVPLILAFLALRIWFKNRKIQHVSKDSFSTGFFILLLFAAWLVSQPPWWQIGPLKLYMPSYFFYKVMPMFRAYCRFGVVVMLSVAVLAGIGLKFILDKRRSLIGKIVLTVVSCGLVLFEFWNYPPFKVMDLSRVPAVYYWLKAQPGDFVIAEYPIDAFAPKEIYKFYQTKHQKRMINATIPTTPANQLANTLTKLSDINTTGVLKWMGVRFVLVHNDEYNKTELTEWINELKNIPSNPGLRFLRSFNGIDVYEINASPKVPAIRP